MSALPDESGLSKEIAPPRPSLRGRAVASWLVWLLEAVAWQAVKELRANETQKQMKLHGASRWLPKVGPTSQKQVPAQRSSG